MNIADYLSELLGQHSEVSVPGLGYFVRERVNGYYNDKEAKIYPPCYRVKFVPDMRDDDIFAQYVADKKNISLASSKYFIEKFISKLKEDAGADGYVFAGLGQFHTNLGQLVFTPFDEITTSPAFYGYAPVNIHKIKGAVDKQPVKPALAIPVLPPVTTPPAFEQAASKRPYIEQEEEETATKKGIGIWYLLLTGIAVIAIAVLVIYKFYPDKMQAAFNKITGKQQQYQDTVEAVVRHPQIKTDTVKKIAPVTDTALKTTTSVADTLKPHWEIIEGSFNKLPAATAAVKILKDKGIDAKILTDAPGPRLKISVGAYPSFKEADSVKNLLIKAGKISKQSYPYQIPDKQ